MSIRKTVTVMIAFLGAILLVLSIMTGSIWGLLFAGGGLGLLFIILGITEVVKAKNPPAPAILKK